MRTFYLKYLFFVLFQLNVIATLGQLPTIRLDGNDIAITIDFHSENSTDDIWSIPPVNRAVNATCEAPYPITLSYIGYIPEEIIKVYDSSLERGSVYTQKIQIDYNKTGDQMNLRSSIRVTCVSYKNGNVSRNLFFSGGMMSKQFIESGKTINITDERLLPCAVSVHNATVKLYITSKRGVVEYTTYEQYDRVLGFYLKRPRKGNFFCTSAAKKNDQGKYDDIVYINSYLSQLSRASATTDHFYPSETKLEYFINQTLYLGCESEIDPIDFSVVNIQPGILPNITYQINSTMIKNISINSLQPVSLEVSCSNPDETIQTWNVFIYENPYLEINNVNDLAVCQSKISNLFMKSAYCANISDCNVANFEIRRHYGSRAITTMNVTYEHNLGTARFLYFNGIIQCEAGMDKDQMFFTYLNYFSDLNVYKHTNWTTVPIQDLFRMDDVNDILYFDIVSSFFCEAVSYLFKDNLKFSMEFLNGTSLPVDDSLYQSEYNRKIHGLNFITSFKMLLPAEAVAVTCHAEWLHSSEALNITEKFTLRHLRKPIITMEEDAPVIPSLSNETESNFIPRNVNRDPRAARSKNVTFLIGNVTSNKLVCNATGEPKVKYTWFYNGNTLIACGNTSEVMKETGESILVFGAAISLLTAGNYTCEASNLLGKATISFNVTTEDRSIPAQSYLVLTLALVFSLLFGIITVSLLFVAYVQYNKLKKKLRNLTGDEYKRFFEGNPEIMQRAGNIVTAENVYDSPYDRHYEIDLEDIDFTECILGAGHFSHVTKARVKSLDTDVAVKVANETTDIETIKGMMSEVKILTYIGIHQNLVKLVGANTANIQRRSIYILLEFNENGSMEKYLRKNKSSFQNLLYDSHENWNGEKPRPFTHVATSDGITTLDLIRWSKEIAQGMEYLTIKNVVHADLALRNVLLNKERVAKVSDFGLSRQLFENADYTKKSNVPLPFRWMSLESLKDRVFSVETDVWSYGICLWEMYTLGEEPFKRERWGPEFIERLESGVRLGRPTYCSPQIYQKIQLCWEEDKTLRPTFTNLREYFETISKEVSSAHEALYQELTLKLRKTQLEESKLEVPYSVRYSKSPELPVFKKASPTTAEVHPPIARPRYKPPRQQNYANEEQFELHPYQNFN